MTIFQGFNEPVENWSKLPHEIIKLLPEFSSLAELKVVLYILRHTWGYREYEAAKTITGDEFANGRKMKDGTRLDNGVGMGEPAIRDGLKRAIEHGFITVQTDKTDKARIQKSYRLNMVNAGVENQPSEDRKSTLSDMKINPRSEKDTLERQTKKENTTPQKNVASYPKSLKRWKPEHSQRYFAENFVVLSDLVSAWGYDLKLYDLIPHSERMEFIETHQGLVAARFDVENYGSLAAHARVKTWKNNPRVMVMLEWITDWRNTRLQSPKEDEPKTAHEMTSYELQIAQHNGAEFEWQ